MANLLASIRNAADALGAYDQVLNVTQNNVANASTPGYVKQSLSLQAKPLDLTWGSLGGVDVGEVQSGRNEYAEQAVWQQNVLLGQAQQNVSSLQTLNSLFDVTGQSGIDTALNRLFQSFSAWGQSPTDTNARQNVLDRAGDVANSFRQAAAGLATLRQDTENQLDETVTHINAITGKLKELNRQIMAGESNNAGIDAQVHSLLEELSQYVDFTAAKQADGSYSVLVNGQVPLLIEDKAYNLTYQLQSATDPAAPYPGAPASAQILSSDGADDTGQVTGGQLGALLEMRNQVLPSYLGDAYHIGDLNDMAKQFADRVNAVLTAGEVNSGDPANDVPPTMGVPIFQYDTPNATNVAASLQLDQTVTPGQMGPIDPGPPYIYNGVPLNLSALASPQTDQDKIHGYSFSAYYGAMAARAGSLLNDAQDELDTRQSTVAQAKDLRQQMSGVSLDEEAAILVQFQRAYEANSRLITILDQLTQDTINMLQP